MQQFKTPFNACCSLVLVCKDIIPKYGRTRSKRFFSTVGTFSLTRWTLFKNCLKKLELNCLKIELFKKLEDLKEYFPYKDFGDKELKSKYCKIQLAHMSNEIDEK